MRARDNPFRSERVEGLAFRNPGFSWSGLEASLAAAGGRGAIVGPEGHGKTTLLLEWHARSQAAGREAVHLRVGRGQRRLDAAQKRRIAGAVAVFADSAEQLGWTGWREFVALTRRARSVVVTTHRPGRFATVYLCRTSPALLQELVEELHPSGPECRLLWHRHRGNLRNALRELYDKMSPEIPATK